MKKAGFCWLMCVLVTAVILLASYTLKSDIVLSDEPLQINPEGFYIDAVIDERTDTVAMAMLAIVTAGNKKPEMQAASLQGGVAPAVSRFINRNLKKDTSARAVSISIKNLKVTETILPDGSIDGRIQLSISFSQLKNYGPQQLVSYSGGLHYIRAAANGKIVEAHLRTALKSGLVYFNNWMKINLDNNPILAKAVSISITDYTEKTEGDTIYYSPARPLTWNDFQSKTAPTRKSFTATVMPGFGYALYQEIKSGTIYVRLSMKTYLAKSDSWASKSRSTYGLNHEQRHFDIVRVITRQYGQKVLSAGLTPDTYEAFISMQYLDSYRDMNALQKAYDDETGHGANEGAQLAWDKKIDTMLKD